MTSKFQQFIDGTLPITRSGKCLVESATPLYCAEVLMRNVANNIKDLTEAPQHETAEEAVARYKLARGYLQVLDFMMSSMEAEIMPAIGRLHKLQFPEDEEAEV